MSKSIIGTPIEIFTRHMFTQIIQKLSAFVAENNFSISEMAALHLVKQSEGLSVQELSNKLNLSISATSRLVSGLVKKGLFVRRTHAADARVKIIKCSKKADMLLDDMSIARVSAIIEVAQSLPSNISQQILKAISQFKKE